MQLLRARSEPSLLRQLPSDVFSYVLLPMLRLPPFEGDLRFPGLSSLEMSELVHASF